MKKSLFALAAVTAFAGAAQAQSSVTVYGIADVGYTGITTRGIASGYLNSNAVSAGQAGTKIQSNSFNSGNLATSRLGFRGTEDLGGGLNAFFTVEMGLNLTEGTQFTTMANRQSFVGLGKKGIGQAAIGTQYTPIFNAMTAVNPGANNTVIGSIIYPQTSTAATNSEALTVRRNNALMLQSERMAGFRLQAMYNARNQDRTVGGTAAAPTVGSGNTNNFGYGLGADYQFKKFYVTAAYQSNKNETDAYTSALVNGPATPAGEAANGNNGTFAGSAPIAVANVSDTQMLAGATYDFGVLKAFVGYVNRKLTSGVDSNVYAKRSGQQIGVRGNITPAITAWATIGNGRYQSFGANSPTANFNAWQLGSQYNLSKRTALYAIYGQAQTSSTSTPAGYGLSSGASQYAIGARHSF